MAVVESQGMRRASRRGLELSKGAPNRMPTAFAGLAQDQGGDVSAPHCEVQTAQGNSTAANAAIMRACVTYC